MKGKFVNVMLTVSLSMAMLGSASPVAASTRTPTEITSRAKAEGIAEITNGSDATFTTATSLTAKDWTFMVYMAADNSLDAYAPLDLDEMQSVGSTANINIVVLCDRLGDNNTSLYYVQNGSLMTISSNPEANMGIPATLTEFVRWTAANYLASHYAVILWNHGSGWKTLRALAQPTVKSVCQDITSNTWLSLADLHTALQASGVAVDLLGFDACEMQMIETGYELRGEYQPKIG